MHYICLVVGDHVDEQLEPFAEYQEVERYKVFADAEDLRLMAEHYGVGPTDLDALAARLPDWEKAEGGVEEGRLFYWSTSNPDARFDWYEVGGRFNGYLPLRKAPPVSWWRRLLGRRATAGVNRALKRDVNGETLLANPPAAILVDGQWHECPITNDPAQVAAWRKQFSVLFQSVPDEAMLTVVDVHS